MNSRHCRASLVFACGLLAAGPVWSQETNPNSEKVKFLIEAMSNAESRIRQNAVKQLSEMEDKPFDAIVPVLAKGTQFEAASAAIVLENLKDKDVPIPAKPQAAIYDILSDPATEAWRWNIAAALLTRIAEDSLKNHVDLWTWGVNHPSPMVQLASLRALQKAEEHGTSAESEVVTLLHSHHRPFTGIVVKPQLVTDGFLGYEQAIPAYDPLTILETLVAIKADPHLMAGPLMRLANNDSEYIRLAAATMLGHLDAGKLSFNPHPHAARVLAELATLPWGKVRVDAVRELGDMGKSAATESAVLEDLLEDRVDDVRTQAAISLGELGAAAQSALPALERALRFAELDTQEAVEAITKSIEDIKKAVKDQKTEKSKQK